MRSSSAAPPPVRNRGPYPDVAFPYGAPPAPTRATPSERTAARPPVAKEPTARAFGGTPITSGQISNTKSRDDTAAQNAHSLTRQKFDKHKCTDPFKSDTRKCKTLFSQSYVAGSIPCRLQSSACRYTLQWDAHAMSGFSPDLLLVCADGLTETDHPFTLMAPMMFAELILRAEGCLDLFAPIMEPLMLHMRKAFMSDSDDVLKNGIQAMTLLVQQSGNLVMPYLAKFMMVISKPMKIAKHRDATLALLGTIETNCGPEATKIIKSRIPTYSVGI